MSNNGFYEGPSKRKNNTRKNGESNSAIGNIVKGVDVINSAENDAHIENCNSTKKELNPVLSMGDSGINKEDKKQDKEMNQQEKLFDNVTENETDKKSLHNEDTKIYKKQDRVDHSLLEQFLKDKEDEGADSEDNAGEKKKKKKLRFRL